MNTYFNLTALSLAALLGLTSLTACSQKPSSEEVSAQVKIAMDQAEKERQAALAVQAAEAAKAEAAKAEAAKAAAAPAPVEAPPRTSRKHAATRPGTEHATWPTENTKRVVCSNCAEVLGVKMVEVDGKGSGIGLVTGGVVGGLVGNQVGNGTGRDLATLAGVVGGAFAGNEIEKKNRKTKSYDIRVRMDDGTERTYRQPTDPGLFAGQRVKIENDVVVKN